MTRGAKVSLVIPFPMIRRERKRPTLQVRYLCGQLEFVCPGCRRCHELERVA